MPWLAIRDARIFDGSQVLPQRTVFAQDGSNSYHKAFALWQVRSGSSFVSASHNSAARTATSYGRYRWSAGHRRVHLPFRLMICALNRVQCSWIHWDIPPQHQPATIQVEISSHSSRLHIWRAFLTQKPSQEWAKTRLGERIRSGRPAWCAASATMMVAVYVKATCRAIVDQPQRGGRCR
jgi:hypothetical protein